MADFRCISTVLGIKLFFPYRKDLITSVKSIPGIKFISQDKSWLVPLTEVALTRFQEIVTQYQIPIDEIIQKLIDDKEAFDNNPNQIRFIHTNKICFIYAYNDQITLLLKALGATYERNLKAWLVTTTTSNVRDIRKIIALGGFSTPKSVLELLERLEGGG